MKSSAARTRIMAEWGLLALLYVVTARLGQLLAIPPGNITPVWIPSGIVLAAVLTRGSRVWPGIFLGAFAGNVWAYFSAESVGAVLRCVLAGTANGLGDTLGAVGGAYLITRTTGGSDPLGRAVDVVKLIVFGAVLGSGVSAVLGVTALCLVGFVPWPDYLSSLATWWTGDGVGVLVVAPMLLAWQGGGRGCRFGREELLLAVLLATVVPASLTFFPRVPGFAILPVLMWAIFRLDRRVAFAVVSAVASLVIVMTALGRGPFSGGDLNSRLLGLQLFLTLVTVPMYVLRGALAENARSRDHILEVNRELDERVRDRTRQLEQELAGRKAHEVALLVSETRYRRLFEAAQDGILILDAETGMIVDANPFLVELLGFSHEEFLGKRVWELGLFKDIFANQAHFSALQQKEYVRYEDMPLETADGRRIEVEFVSNVYPVDHRRVIQCNVRDITERRRAERALATLSSRQEAILAAVPDILVEVDHRRIYTWTNQAGLAFFGDDVLGREADFFFEGEQTTYEDVQPLFDGYRDLIYVESWQRRKDGQKRLLAWWCRVLKDERGNVTGALSSARDITEQKQAEVTLQESERRFRETVANLDEGFYGVTLDGVLLEHNRSFSRILGFDQAVDLKGARLPDFWQNPDERRDYLLELAAKGSVSNYPINARKKNGEIMTLLASAHLVKDEHDHPLRIEGVFLDITERKRAEESLRESEERLRLATDAALMGTWERNLKTNGLTWSPMAQRLNGYEPGTFPGTDEAFLELLHPDSRAVYMAAHERVRHGDGVLQAELHFRLRDGRERWGLVYGRLIRDARGQPERIVGIDMDITDRKRLEQERAAIEVQLRQQQKLESIGTLAGGVAHEINNPINGIMNYAQIIQDRLPVDSPLTEFTGEILHETQRVATIVRNLLTFARNEKQSHSPARMADIVEGTLSLIRTVIRHDQITLQVNVPENLPDLRCRTQQIQQVLMNLMTNARDALNERYPDHDPNKVLNVEAHLFEKEGRRWVRLTVEDHGTGITPEVRERMFDPFFTTKPRDKGTGLGLAISHGIVKEHHGELTVETEPGRFTRLHLDLPVDNGWKV